MHTPEFYLPLRSFRVGIRFSFRGSDTLCRVAALCVPFNQPLYLSVLYVLQNHPPLLGVGAPLNLRGSVPSILGRYTTFTASPPIGLRGGCNVTSIIILRFKGIHPNWGLPVELSAQPLSLDRFGYRHSNVP